MTVQGIDFAANRQTRSDYRPIEHKSGIPTVLFCASSLLCAGLRQTLAGTPFVVADGASVETVDRLLQLTSSPALIIIESRLISERAPGVIAAAKERFPQTKIVLLIDNLDLAIVQDGREAGADGFCLTTSDRRVLVTSLELVMLGECVVPSGMFQVLLSRISRGAEAQSANRKSMVPAINDPRAHKLSAREAEILTYLMEGAPNKVIARRLDVAEETVKVHVKAILRKIGMHNRTQAAIWAIGHMPAREGSSLNV